MQVTDNPIRIAFTVNKNNLTHDMIFNTGKFTLSILTTDVPMELIQHFGFKSGREVEKFENYPYAQKNQQGMYYITEKYANAPVSKSDETKVIISYIVSAASFALSMVMVFSADRLYLKKIKRDVSAARERCTNMPEYRLALAEAGGVSPFGAVLGAGILILSYLLQLLPSYFYLFSQMMS